MTEELEVYKFLEELRKSGKTNMLGSVPYIIEEFGIDKPKARKLLINYLKRKKNG